MAGTNLERMLALADEFFATRNDPTQISVTEQTMEKLAAIHPATLAEEANDRGPIAWVLVLPTSRQLMEEFLSAEITERDLLERTPVGGTYDALYLCSALVLPEYREKGVAKRLALQAIRSIQARHPIGFLFYWAFSGEGEELATTLAKATGLPLFQRAER